MSRIFVSLLFSAAVIFAQIGPIPPAQILFPPQLTSYLELTDEQVRAITQANVALNEFRTTKLQRQLQVQSELSQETAKPTPDAMALGLRYVELEAIRRELQAEQQKTFTTVQNILSGPQKTKLTALQQSLQLYSMACAAASQNLIGPVPAGSIAANRIDPTQNPIASFLLGAPTCNSVGGVIRSGTFTPNSLFPVP